MRTIKILSNDNKIKWDILPNDWFKQIPSPNNILKEDYENLFYCEIKSNDSINLYAVVGKFLERYYIDSEKYITENNYFISFFMKNKSSFIKGKMILNSELNDYQIEKVSSIKELSDLDVNQVKKVYEFARDKYMELEDNLEDFLIFFTDDEEKEEG